MKDSVSTGIVLDKTLSNAFRIQAHDEGLAVGENSRIEFYRKNYHTSSLVDQSLTSLVLFDKLYLESSSSSYYEESNKERYVSSSNYVNWKKLTDLDAVGFCASYFNGMNDSIDDIDCNFIDQNINILANLVCKYSFIQGANTRLADAIKSISKITHFARINQESDPSRIDYSMSPNALTIYELPNLIKIGIDMLDFREAYNSLISMGLTSEDLNIPAMGPFNDMKITSDESDITSPDALRTYRIVLEEDYSFPSPRTITSALELRDDKLITEVRLFINGWANAVCRGETDEGKFRKEIRKSKKSLSRLGSYRKVGRLMSFVSIPVAVAAALSGVPYGLALLPIGPAITVDSIRREKKHNWMMFGKM